MICQVSSLLLAKDDKGKSKLIELVTKSEGRSASAEACAALVDKLCASSPAIKAAVVSTDMFLALAKSSTAGVALKLVKEKGLEVFDEDIALLMQASDATQIDPDLDASALSRWYTFGDGEVEGEGKSLRVANRAGEVNPNLEVDEAQSLVPDKDHQPPVIKDKHGRAVAEFDGDHALVSTNLGGCPTGNDAYTVEVQLTHPHGGSALGGWQVAFFLGKPNCNGQNIGVGVNGNSKGMSNFWWSNDCAKEGAEDDIWKRADEAKGDEESVWLRLAATWDPSKQERKIFMNGTMINEDNAQGSEHRKFGPADGAVLALGDVVGEGNPFGKGLAIKACIAEVRVWNTALEPSLLFRELGGAKMSALKALVMHSSEASQALADYLLAKVPDFVPSAIAAVCKPSSAATALKLLNAYPSVALDAALVETLLAKDGEKLKKLVLNESCTQLVEALCGKDATIKAAVTAPAMLAAAVATPETAGVALKLIETYGIEITDEVS